METYKIKDRFAIGRGRVQFPPDNPKGTVLIVDCIAKGDVALLAGKDFKVYFSNGSARTFCVDIVKDHLKAISFFVRNVEVEDFENATHVEF